MYKIKNKSKFKMDQRPYCKTWIFESARGRKQRWKFKSSHNVYLYFPRAGITSVHHTPSRYRKLPPEQDLNYSREKTLRINKCVPMKSKRLHTKQRKQSL